MRAIPTSARRTVVAVATTATLGVAASLAATGTALADAATPPQTGCPASYSLLYVPDLTAQGYHAPAQIDDQANGGNGDHYVCGKPVQQEAAQNFCGGPCQVPVLYEFRDDTLTPSH